MPTVREFLEQSAHFTKYGKDSCQALEVLNKAIRVLWPRGTWQGTVEFLCLDTQKSCFYLPFSSYNIIEARAGKANVKMESSWFMYIPRNRVSQCCDYSCSRPVLSPTGIVTPFPGKYVANSRLGFRAENINDAGKSLTIQYRSEDFSVKTQTFQLTDGKQYTEYEVAEIISLKKDRTSGSVAVFAVQATGDSQRVHTLHHAETTSSYTEYEFTGSVCDTLILKTKKRRIQLTEEDFDALLPLDPDAVEFAIQAVIAKEAEDYANYATSMQLAEEQLQEEQLEMQSQRTSSMVNGGIPHIAASSLDYDACR